MYGGLRGTELTGILLIVIAGFVLPHLLPGYFLYTGNMLLTYAILAIGLDLLLAWSGQFAFAHIAFFGIGIYGTAVPLIRRNLSPGLSLPATRPSAARVGGRSC